MLAYANSNVKKEIMSKIAIVPAHLYHKKGQILSLVSALIIFKLFQHDHLEISFTDPVHGNKGRYFHSVRPSF